MKRIFTISVDQLPSGSRQAEVMSMVSQTFSSLGKTFFVIGATARDIIATTLRMPMSKRKTADLDITIAIENWTEFNEIKDALVNKGFRQDSRIQQRLYHGRGESEYMLDLVPFGKVAEPDKKFSWPGESDTMISVDGFESAFENAIKINVSDLFSFMIPDIPSLFVLKLFAWKDRSVRYEYKDAVDMDFLIRNYYFPNSTEPRMYGIYERVSEEDGCEYVWGASMMATDIVNIVTKVELKKISDIVEYELLNGEHSKLITSCLPKDPQKEDLTQILTGWRYFGDILKESL